MCHRRLGQPARSRAPDLDHDGHGLLPGSAERGHRQYGTPEIFNTDQGSQFTSLEFTGALHEHGVQISMDGRGSWRDNVFVERLWRSIKYEEVYLHAYESVSQAKAGIGRYIEFYNTRRPHSTLDKQTPDEFYFASLGRLAEAA